MSDQHTPPAGDVPPRDERVMTVTFNQQWGSYFAGESAAFLPHEAEALARLGVAEAGGPGEPPPDPNPHGEFSALAGIETPPRYWPPNPQHPEIVQTFDPSPLHQLERTKRDLESGKPGSAGREDYERAVAAVRDRPANEGPVGAGPQPQPYPGQRPPRQAQPDEVYPLTDRPGAQDPQNPPVEPAPNV